MVCFCPNAQVPSSSALELQHRQSGTAGNGRRVDGVERRPQRRQGGERASRRRGGDCAPRVVVGVVVIVIVIGIVIRFSLVMVASLLEGFECRGKGPHDLAPSGHRGACVFAPHQRDAGADAKRSILGDFEAARFGAEFDLFRRAHRLGDDVVAGETETDQRRDRGVLVMPMALGAAGRERVAGHEVAALKGALGLVVQRLADVLDRVDEVQAGGEQLQVGSFEGGAAGVGTVELREIEQRTGVRRADRPGRAEAAMAPRSRRGVGESASSQAAR